MQLSVNEHDRAVRHYAMRMLADGFEVKARVEGWFQEPDTIGGYRLTSSLGRTIISSS